MCTVLIVKNIYLQHCSFYDNLFSLTKVKVPDPEIVKELEKSHEEITIIRTKVTTLHETISTLKTEISQQNAELAKQRSRIAELEAQLATVKAGGGVVAPLGLPESTVSDEVSNIYCCTYSCMARCRGLNFCLFLVIRTSIHPSFCARSQVHYL